MIKIVPDFSVLSRNLKELADHLNSDSSHQAYNILYWVFQAYER